MHKLTALHAHQPHGSQAGRLLRASPRCWAWPRLHVPASQAKMTRWPAARAARCARTQARHPASRVGSAQRPQRRAHGATVLPGVPLRGCRNCGFLVAQYCCTVQHCMHCNYVGSALQSQQIFGAFRQGACSRTLTTSCCWPSVGSVASLGCTGDATAAKPPQPCGTPATAALRTRYDDSTQASRGPLPAPLAPSPPYCGPTWKELSGSPSAATGPPASSVWGKVLPQRTARGRRHACAHWRQPAPGVGGWLAGAAVLAPWRPAGIELVARLRNISGAQDAAPRRRSAHTTGQAEKQAF